MDAFIHQTLCSLQKDERKWKIKLRKECKSKEKKKLYGFLCHTGTLIYIRAFLWFRWIHGDKKMFHFLLTVLILHRPFTSPTVNVCLSECLYCLHAVNSFDCFHLPYYASVSIFCHLFTFFVSSSYWFPGNCYASQKQPYCHSANNNNKGNDNSYSSYIRFGCHCCHLHTCQNKPNMNETKKKEFWVERSEKTRYVFV